MYTITNYTRKQAKKRNVTVKRSVNPKKKIDVYKNGEKIASVGATGYKDYPTYMREDGKKIANEHRRRYKIRHQKDRNVVGSNGWYADKLLW